MQTAERDTHGIGIQTRHVSRILSSDYKALASAWRIAAKIGPEEGSNEVGNDDDEEDSMSPLPRFRGLSRKTPIEANDGQFGDANCDEEQCLIDRAEVKEPEQVVIGGVVDMLTRASSRDHSNDQSEPRNRCGHCHDDERVIPAKARGFVSVSSV